MSTLPLFDNPVTHPIARKSDPVSSKEAAHKLTDSGKRQTQCNTILALVKRYPGRTSLELAELTFEFDRYIFARRLADLEHMGLVRKASVRTCKESGNRAVTWEAI